MHIVQSIFALLLSIQNTRGLSLCKEQRDYNVYINRLCQMAKNKIMLKPPYSYCMYCNGHGYMSCLNCNNGCWRCSKSTLIPCKFCVGDGKGKYAYRDINI